MYCTEYALNDTKCIDVTVCARAHQANEQALDFTSGNDDWLGCVNFGFSFFFPFFSMDFLFNMWMCLLSGTVRYGNLDVDGWIGWLVGWLD